jgi:hypothetical protein
MKEVMVSGKGTKRWVVEKKIKKNIVYIKKNVSLCIKSFMTE